MDGSHFITFLILYLDVDKFSYLMLMIKLFLVPVLLAAGKIATIFPLHDREALAVLHGSWVRGFTHRQPLDSVAEYFGIKIALYFAWLGHYTTALLFPAIVGLFCWLLIPSKVSNWKFSASVPIFY